MKTKPKQFSTAIDALPALTAIFAQLPPQEQQKAISSISALIDIVPSEKGREGKLASAEGGGSQHGSDGISVKAQAWMRKFTISPDQIEQVFSIDDQAVDVIATKMPSNKQSEQTVQSYIICGLRTFIQTGDLTFVDDDARSLCSTVGCYDQTNHSRSIKTAGNLFCGSKAAGWKLTNPGLAEAANIIKRLASSTEIK